MKKKYTIEDAIKECKRELKMREKVYPRWIADKKLNRDRAANQYRALRYAIELLEEKAGTTYKQTSLFPTKNNHDAKH